MKMIVTVTPNPALDKIYWVERLSQDPETPLTRATKSISSPGGKGINVSVFLAQLGLESIAMGFIAGHTGRVIENSLRELGVTTNFVWTDGETRINMTILERGKEDRPIEVSESGPQIEAAAIEQFMRKYKRILGRAAYVVLGGSLPPGVDPGLYKELIRLAQEHNVPTIINAGGEALRLAVEAAPYMVKPDVRERKEVCGVQIDSSEKLMEVCKALVNKGTKIVLLSHEITGDLLITPDGIWDFVARDVVFQNIVGAEDALVGGMVYKLYQGSSIEEAARFGMAAAIANSESPKVMDVDKQAIEKEMEKVQIKRLA